MPIVSDQIRDFLQFITLQFINHPEQAQLKVAEIGGSQLRFRLVVEESDIAILIGKNGFTASAIRNVLKAAAQREGLTATLQIVTHQEEAARNAAIEAGQTPSEVSQEDEETLDESDDRLEE